MDIGVTENTTTKKKIIVLSWFEACIFGGIR